MYIHKHIISLLLSLGNFLNLESVIFSEYLVYTKIKKEGLFYYAIRSCRYLLEGCHLGADISEVY